uniref:Uncharacterized protein MANES_15G071400 n=1 Tax=Rhizophora mucronata TaxID=61149 RepID=A0A2P2K478_RHIMU
MNLPIFRYKRKPQLLSCFCNHHAMLQNPIKLSSKVLEASLEISNAAEISHRNRLLILFHHSHRFTIYRHGF